MVRFFILIIYFSLFCLLRFVFCLNSQNPPSSLQLAQETDASLVVEMLIDLSEHLFVVSLFVCLFCLFCLFVSFVLFVCFVFHSHTNETQPMQQKGDSLDDACYQNITNSLVNEAVHRGSSDNVSVVLVIITPLE